MATKWSEDELDRWFEEDFLNGAEPGVATFAERFGNEAAKGLSRGGSIGDRWLFGGDVSPTDVFPSDDEDLWAFLETWMATTAPSGPNAQLVERSTTSRALASEGVGWCCRW